MLTPISQYLNKIEETNDSVTTQNLIDILRAWKTLCDNYYYNPTWRHAEGIIREISDWEVEW